MGGEGRRRDGRGAVRASGARRARGAGGGLGMKTDARNALYWRKEKLWWRRPDGVYIELVTRENKADTSKRLWREWFIQAAKKVCEAKKEGADVNPENLKWRDEHGRYFFTFNDSLTLDACPSRRGWIA